MLHTYFAVLKHHVSEQNTIETNDLIKNRRLPDKSEQRTLTVECVRR